MGYDDYAPTPKKEDLEIQGDIDIRLDFVDRDCPEWLKKRINENEFTLNLSDFSIPDGETRWIKITRDGDGPIERFISPSSSYPDKDDWQAVDK